MLTKQFHDEAFKIQHAKRFSAEDTFADFDDKRVRAAITPLLVRMFLNGWITDKEKVFLDCLAPENCLTFMVKNHTYIHPEGLELFPFEEIETTATQAGEAIFSHRYRPEALSASGQNYRIFSAVINPQDEQKIVLGFFGPEHLLGRFSEDCQFARLVNTCRDIHAVVGSSIGSLTNCMNRRSATILIDRSSGRLLSVNRQASRLLSRSERVLVDIGLDQLRYHISPLLPEYNLKLDNLDAAGLSLSVITFEPGSSGESSDRRMISQSVDRIRVSAANLSDITARLREMTRLVKTDESKAVINTIINETGRINALTKQLSLALRIGQAPVRPQNLEDELSRAIEDTVAQLTRQPQVAVKTDENTPSVAAPDDAFRHVFYEILQAHVAFAGACCDHSVAMSASDQGGTRIVFKSALQENEDLAGLSPQADMFTQQLAEQLGVEVKRHLFIENGNLVTELTIKG